MAAGLASTVWGHEGFGSPLGAVTQARSAELVEQSPRLFQIGSIEAFGEPAVDRCQQIAGFGLPTVLAQQPGQAHRPPQFKPACALLDRNPERGTVSGLDFRPIRRRQAVLRRGTSRA